MAQRALRLSEVFGPSIQGEGPTAGEVAMFVRLAGCNLACDWCDTRYSWDWSRFSREQESRSVPIDEILAWLRLTPVRRLVVTGGEPMLQQEGIAELLSSLRGSWQVEVETAGTIFPHLTASGLTYNVSPKLSSAGLPAEVRLRPGPLRAFAESGQACFKFVVREPDELEEVEEIAERYGLTPVYISPEGTDPELLAGRAKRLAGPVQQRGWTLSPRLHIALFGDERGR